MEMLFSPSFVPLGMTQVELTPYSGKDILITREFGMGWQRVLQQVTDLHIIYLEDKEMDWRRAIIDSRYKTKDSVSDSDFRCELPHPMQIAAGSMLYVDGVCLSHSWPTVQTDVNDRLYVHGHISGQTAPIERIIQLTQGTYNAQTLAAELLTKLNLGRSLFGAYTVTLLDGKMTIGNLSDEPTQGSAEIFSKEWTDGPLM